MAGPQTLAGTKLLILVGDGATPTEVFDAPCGLNTKGIDFSAATSDETVPDCDNPDATPWILRITESLSSQVSGSGLMDKASFAVWRVWLLSGEARNVQIKLNNSDLGHFSGSYVLTSFKLAADGKKRVTVEVTMDSDGAVTWTDAA